jgi:hypothetical protein
MAITPVMWDFLYCTTIGQTVPLRRELRDQCVLVSCAVLGLGRGRDMAMCVCVGW